MEVGLRHEHVSDLGEDRLGSGLGSVGLLLEQGQNGCEPGGGPGGDRTEQQQAGKQRPVRVGERFCRAEAAAQEPGGGAMAAICQLAVLAGRLSARI